MALAMFFVSPTYTTAVPHDQLLATQHWAQPPQQDGWSQDNLSGRSEIDKMHAFCVEIPTLDESPIDEAKWLTLLMAADVTGDEATGDDLDDQGHLEVSHALNIPEQRDHHGQ